MTAILIIKDHVQPYNYISNYRYTNTTVYVIDYGVEHSII